MGFSQQKLGDVCRLINGRAYKKHEMLSEGPYPILRVGNFFTNRSWFYSDLELNDDKYCDNGDLLYAWSASFGPRIWEGQKVIYHYHIWKIEIDETKVDKHYMFHLLDWDTEQIKLAQGTGTTMVHVTKGAMENRVLPFPSIPEQQHIVAILDQAFADIEKARANAEKNLKNARELFDSYLQQVFSQRGEGWEVRPLESFSTIVNGFAFKSGDFSPNNKAKSIKITNVGVYNFVEESDNYLPKDYLDKYDSYKAYEGDIVVALTRTIISAGLKVAVVPTNYDASLINQRVAAVQVNENIMPKEMLQAFLSTSIAIKYVKSNVSELMQPNLSIKDLKAFPIPVPPSGKKLAICNNISDIKNQVDQLVGVYETKLKSLDELKKSLLQKAFSGELTKSKGIAA